MVYDLEKDIIQKQYKSGRELVLDMAFNDKETELFVVGVKKQSIFTILTEDKPQNIQNAY